MLSLVTDLRLVLAAAAAFTVGAGIGNFRGEWVGRKSGERICQAKNRAATDKKNAEITRDAAVSAAADAAHAERVKAAIQKADANADKSQQCTVLTDKERAAIDAIRD